MMFENVTYYSLGHTKSRRDLKVMTISLVDKLAVVELGLWSILSTAAVIKTWPRNCGEHTTCSLWICWQTWFLICVQRLRTLSQNTIKPRCAISSTNSLLCVWAMGMQHQSFV